MMTPAPCGSSGRRNQPPERREQPYQHGYRESKPVEKERPWSRTAVVAPVVHDYRRKQNMPVFAGSMCKCGSPCGTRLGRQLMARKRCKFLMISMKNFGGQHGRAGL